MFKAANNSTGTYQRTLNPNTNKLDTKSVIILPNYQPELQKPIIAPSVSGL
jgi:hypothetical protein